MVTDQAWLKYAPKRFIHGWKWAALDPTCTATGHVRPIFEEEWLTTDPLSSVPDRVWFGIHQLPRISGR